MAVVETFDSFLGIALVIEVQICILNVSLC